jgi:hypothetical protein
MGLVSVLCVVLAFVHHALRHWGPDEVTIIALSILLATNILAWFQDARWQVFWIGFGMVGFAYLMISLGPWSKENLPTTWLLDGLYDRLYSIRAIPTFGNDFDDDASVHVHAYAFIRAGHSVISLLLALLAGIGATWLYSGKCNHKARRHD